MLRIKKSISVTGAFGLIDVQRTPDFSFNGESHPFWEMVYVREGKVGVSADGRIYNLAQGDAIFHKPGEFHRIWSTGDVGPKLYILTFEAKGEGMKRFENLTIRPDERSVRLLERIVDRGKRGFEFERNYLMNGVADERFAQEYVDYLEIFLLGISKSDLVDTLPADSSADSRLFFDTVVWLRNHIGEKICIDGVAQTFFVSSSRIKKLFSKYTGVGVIEYFTNMKILEAQKMLSDGASVSETAERLGFSNQFYFSTVFKKTTGTSPSEYKKIRNVE